MVKDPIMKIKKKSKSKLQILDMSNKNASNGDPQDEQITTNAIEIESKEVKHKKHKKEKRKISECEQTPKKQKTSNITEETTVSNTLLVNDRKEVAGKIANQENDLSHVLHSKRKDTLMARLRNASTHISNVLSVLHIPKHKTPGADDSEEDEG